MGLITRCKDEFFIKEFCDYYLSEGVDKIYIIDDDSVDKSIYTNITSEQVNVLYEKNVFNGLNREMDIVNKLYETLRNDFEWIISLDVDEFITTKKTIKKTIKEELKTTFKNVDCIKIPWVMMAINNREKNPISVLRENTSRWYHDKRHPRRRKHRSSSQPRHPALNPDHQDRLDKKFGCRYDEIEVKCIFRAEKFEKVGVHIPYRAVGECLIVDSVKMQSYEWGDCGCNYKNLREKDIREGYLLCYHYRFISIENAKKKLTNTPYLNFTLDDLIESDYPEICDETLMLKSLNIGTSEGCI